MWRYIIIPISVNVFGIWAAGKYVEGFMVPESIWALIVAGVVLSLINLAVRPFLRLIFSPLILLTMGLALIAVNMLVLYLLDYLLTSITIDGLLPLLLGTLIISAVNVVLRFILL
ncbi:MAG: phage holin family protein [Candidatus Colwellbacteria bacterium]|nr:phage holin family protein [Candidatus Colwellbacteria bacterium]